MCTHISGAFNDVNPILVVFLMMFFYEDSHKDPNDAKQDCEGKGKMHFLW